MEKYELQKLRDLPIEGVAERLGLHVERHRSLCPFHDDHTPSLTFRNNRYKCWSCGESGDSISLAMKVLDRDFPDACRWLAGEEVVSGFRFQVSGKQEHLSLLCLWGLRWDNRPGDAPLACGLP